MISTERKNPLFVSTACFEGPLDLLVYLVRAEEVDFREVSISAICDSFLAVIERSRELDIEIGAEFLSTAALLLELKSRMLLPGSKPLLEDAPDPRKELVERIVQYRSCKAGAAVLRDLETVSLRTFLRGSFEDILAPAVEESRSYNAYDLYKAWTRLRAQTYANSPRVIRIDRKPIEHYSSRIREVLRIKGSISFSALVSETTDKVDIIAFFLALLELVKSGDALVYQGETFGEIRIGSAHEQ